MRRACFPNHNTERSSWICDFFEPIELEQGQKRLTPEEWNVYSSHRVLKFRTPLEFDVRVELPFFIRHNRGVDNLPDS